MPLEKVELGEAIRDFLNYDSKEKYHVVRVFEEGGFVICAYKVSQTKAFLHFIKEFALEGWGGSYSLGIYFADAAGDTGDPVILYKRNEVEETDEYYSSIR